MYQYDDPTAASAMPAPAAPGTPGFFTDGSPSGGVPATILRADFMNAVMMELLNVVEAAGLTPSKTSDNQVLTAIQTLIADAFPSSLGPTGWRQMPDGSIEQWGTGTLPASGTSTSTVAIVFPKPFTTACYQVSGSFQGKANSSAGGFPSFGTVGAPSETGCSVAGDCLGYTTFNQTVPFTWFAIGK